MTDKQNVLAIDVGTQSVGAFAFDARGNLIDSARVAYDRPYVSPKPGWAEQDPTHYWDCLGRACRALWAQEVVTPASLAGVALTSQRSTVINLDQEGRPLRPAIVWLDQRRAKALPPLPGFLRTLFKLVGVAETVDYLQAEAEINWIHENEPAIWEATAHYLFLSGYLNYRLTGRAVDSTGGTVGYVPFDYKKHCWLPDKNWKWRAIRVKPGTLPELSPPGSELGTITGQAGTHTGLPPGLPVFAGASDKACEVLGVGCLADHQACIGYGTTATINVNSARYIEPIRLFPPYPSAQPGAYNLEVQVYRGFWMVTWFKEQFCHLEESRAREMGVDAEVLLEELAADVPPGSLGLMLQPYWSPGVRNPGPEAKGSIIGFGGAHHKEHVYRALLEGLAYGMRHGRERIEKKTKQRLTELHLCGGGSKSDLVMQITADVFKLPAIRPAAFEASALGAAMLASWGAGVHPDLETAVGAMAHRARVFEPKPANVDLYERLYRRVYLRLYGRLRPLYLDVMDITGYPDAPGRSGS
ncbi:MAG: FGGY-family carbohydrate kinase [Proteobacteria bacterium]|nr:FGGY-family carbohydrate kinase [Pseudomonadota bacterium]MBU1741004.1 FGGY-family carbohydrate kinase [Pseudomonadota bacterium]